MKRGSFDYRKFTALSAILVFTLVLGLASTSARSTAARVAVSKLDLANEERVLAKYFDDLVAYHKQSEEFGKRASFLSADLEPLQRKSDDLQGRLSGLQNTFGDIVRKLKAANEWDDLDTATEARITDASLKSFSRETSFKQLLEESSGNLTSRKNEISAPLDTLRKRLTSRYGDGADFQIVRAAYEPAAPLVFFSVRCSIGVARMKLIIKLGGTPTNSTLHDVHEACHPPGALNPF